MTSPVAICSNALLLLGKSPISSFEEGNDRARYASNLYPMAKPDLLRAHPWNFSCKRVLLSPLVTPPAFGFTAQFQLPGDYVRLVQVGYPGRGCPDFAMEDGKILANATALPLRYVYDADNEATWDSKMVFLAVRRMAWELAYPVTQSTTLRDSMEAAYIKALREAKAIDAQENPSETLGDDFPLIQGRY